MKKSDFGSDFVFGTATAAYQIEGAWNEDGKGESVWDRFCRKKKKIKTGETGDIACDHYHRYESDLDLMASLGLRNYRFSLAWTRIFPDGSGHIEQRGVDFYNRLIDACLKRNITPWVTLYHWDLPQVLQDRGGWTNRDVLGRFQEYVDFSTKKFSDRVKKWMILNEPFVFTAAGYLLGIHAPGERRMKKFLAATHHAALAQADGGRIARSNCPGGEIGTTFSCTHMEPYRNIPRDVRAAERFDAVVNRLFLDPVCGRGYPVDSFPYLRKIERHFQEGDESRLKHNFDFIGLQNYTRDLVKFSLFIPYVRSRPISAKKRGKEQTDMGWEVYPPAIYHLLKKYAAYPEIKKIYVTENGAAFPDVVENGRVHDERRIKFYQEYMGQVLRAKNEGVPVAGYFVWSFMDNFEWAEGYRPRFGMVHNDYATQTRTPKDSALWFRDFLA